MRRVARYSAETVIEKDVEAIARSPKCDLILNAYPDVRETFARSAAKKLRGDRPAPDLPAPGI